jgi:hypothetical protein
LLSVDDISEEENLKFYFTLLHDIVDGDSIDMEVSELNYKYLYNSFFFSNDTTEFNQN